MELGQVDSIKLEIVGTITDDFVRLETETGEEKLELRDFFSNGRSFGEALLLHAKNRRDTTFDLFHDPNLSRWTFVDLPNGKTSVQLWHLDEFALMNPNHERASEWQDFELTCSFEKIVDAYRFMLKQYLNENGQERFRVSSGFDFPAQQLNELDKLSIN